MAYSLHNLTRPKAQAHRKKRVGRGNASGKGTYSGRGMKGQKSRTGGTGHLARRAAFQQLLIRTPKLRGFKSQAPQMESVNIGELGRVFAENDTITAKKLVNAGLIRTSRRGYKVLAQGKLGKKLTVRAHAFSAAAEKAIKAAGGECEVVER